MINDKETPDLKGPAFFSYSHYNYCIYRRKRVIVLSIKRPEKGIPAEVLKNSVFYCPINYI